MQSRKLARKHLARIFWFFFAVMIAYWVYRGYHGSRSDVWAYHNAGIRALAGTDLYVHDPTPFKYAPVVSYLFVPLSFFSLKGAEIVSILLSGLAWVLIYFGIVRRWGYAVAAALLAAMFRFHNYDFINLQVNHWILLLILVYWKLRERSPWISAACFALASMFKLLPGAWVVALFIGGKRAEALRIAACALGMLLFPLLTFEPGPQLYVRWAELLRLTTPFPAPIDPIFQSIPTMLWSVMHDWGAGAERAFQGIRLALFAGFLLLSTYPMLRKNAREDGELSTLSAILLVGALFSPLAWKHAYVLALPAYLVLALRSDWRRFWVAAFLMSALPSILHLFPGAWGDRSFVTVLGAVFLGWAAVTRKSTLVQGSQPAS